MPRIDRFIESYEKQAGFRYFTDSRNFSKYVYKRHGKPKIDALFDVITRRADDESIDIYPLLYENVDVSIDFLIFDADLHRNYMQWVLDREFNPLSKILDIACGNGYLTCFHAKKFPESEVIGIDNSAEAIKCAVQLAQRLNLQNVRFELVDITEREFLSVTDTFDLITAITSFKSALEFPDFQLSEPSRSLIKHYRKTARVVPVNHVAKLIRPETGVFISLEKWGQLRSYGWWACALQNAGLMVDFNESKAIVAKSIVDGGVHQFPVLWCRKSPTVNNTLDETIAFWLYSAYQKDFNLMCDSF